MSADTILTIPAEAKGKRIDVVIADLTKLSRNQVRKLIADRVISLDGKTVTKPGVLIGNQSTIAIQHLPEERNRVIPEDIPLNIIYEDDYILAVNKKPGLVVHPGVGHKDNTLINALEAYREKHNLPPLRLLHRLDKDTSGILLVSKDEQSFTKFGKMFEQRDLQKVYLALVYATPKKLKGYIDAPIERSGQDRQKFTISASSHSRRALTAYQVLDFFGDVSLWALQIHTGRTHQIRVHSSSIGHPVLGDMTYGNDNSLRLSLELGIKRQLLHAFRITFHHPFLNKQITIEAPLPYDFKQALGTISNKKYKVPSFTFNDFQYHQDWKEKKSTRINIQYTEKQV